MSTIWKQTATTVMIIVSIIFVLDFFWKDATLQAVATDLSNWAVVVGAFALGLGGYSLIQRHSRIIYQRREVWPYSVILLVTMAIFVITGLLTGSITSPQYNWIFRLIVQPLSTTLYGMNAFYIASASYRAFRARSIESMLLLVAAIFLMLRNAPIGGVISPILPQIGKIIWDTSGATGMRAILIGIGIGTLAIAIRIITGQEKRPLGGVD